jgi:hypothetical protein
MPKTAPTKKNDTVAKKKMDTSKLKARLGISAETVSNKPTEWIPFNKAWYDATGLPGIPKGEFSIFRGFSDTGKSTAIYEAVVGAQKTGCFPVIIDTEGSFKFEHAKDVGMVFEEKYDDLGEVIAYEGDFIYMNGGDLVDLYGNYDYKKSKETKSQLRQNPVIEDVSRLVKEVLKAQMEGDIDKDILFVWDSVGSIDCFQSEISESANNQWNAGALNREFKGILHSAIPNSKRATSKYTNTFACVNKIWLDNSGMGMPIIKQSGGEGFLYMARLIFHLGGKTTSSSSKVKATSKGMDYVVCSVTKIEVVKNHLNNLTQMGKIASTAHGYWNPDELTEYKKEYKDFIADKLGGGADDFNVVYVDEDGGEISQDEL